MTLIVFTLPFRRGGTFYNISGEVSSAVIFDLSGEDGLQVDDLLGKEGGVQLRIGGLLMQGVDFRRIIQG